MGCSNPWECSLQSIHRKHTCAEAADGAVTIAKECSSAFVGGVATGGASFLPSSSLALGGAASAVGMSVLP